MKVLLAATHLAAFNYAKELLNKLTFFGNTVNFMTGGKAMERAKEEKIETSNVYPDTPPDVLVCCIAGVEDRNAIEVSLKEMIVSRGTPWIVCEDTEGVASRPFYVNWMLECQPNAVCVTDRFSAERLRNALGARTPNYNGLVNSDSGFMNKNSLQ